MRIKEERKKQARSNKQTRQSNTVHPRQSLFLEKMSCLGRVGLEPTTLYTRDRALYQLSYLGPNLTSHSTPDEQANHQLSIKEKAGVMKPYMYMHPSSQGWASWGPLLYMFLCLGYGSGGYFNNFLSVLLKLVCSACKILFSVYLKSPLQEGLRS